MLIAVLCHSAPKCALKGEDLEVEHALCHPDSCEQHDGNRTSAKGKIAIRNSSTELVSHRNEDANDRKLADFDADIEADERHPQAAFREPGVIEDGGKAKAVNQSESECHQPASLTE